MANAKHQLISVSYTLDPAPIGRATLGVVCVLLEDTDLEGSSARTTTYASSSEVNDAETAGNISTAQADLLTPMFEQIPAPAKIRVADVDVTATAESYADGYNALAAETNDFFYVCGESRVTSDIESLSGALASDAVIHVAQSSAAALLGGTTDTEFANTVDQENQVLCYHDDDTEPLAECYAVARGTFDPDQQSAGWQGRVRGVTAYADGAVSSTQRDSAYDDNVNLMLETQVGDVTGYVSKGVTRNGRQINTLVSVFWYITRITENLLETKLEFDARGEKIPVNEDGQAIVRAELESLYDQGVAAGHFEAGQQLLTFPETITSADKASGTIRTEEHRITVLPNALEFNIGVDFTRDEVNVSVEDA